VTPPGAAPLAAALAVAGAVGLWARYRRFRAAVLARLRTAHPDVRVVRTVPGGLLLDLAGVRGRLDLVGLWRFTRGRGAEAAVDATLDRVRAALPPPRPAPLALVRDRLLPLLKPAAVAATLRRYPPAYHPVTRPFPEGLAVLYVVEGFHQVTYVTAAMTAAWGTDADELHTLALENLRRRTRHVLEELGGPQRAYDHLDGFDATRILVPDLVVPPGIARPVMAIPDEHCLLVGDETERDALRAHAAAAYARADAPLTPALFRPGDAPDRPIVVS